MEEKRRMPVHEVRAELGEEAGLAAERAVAAERTALTWGVAALLLGGFAAVGWPVHLLTDATWSPAWVVPLAPTVLALPCWRIARRWERVAEARSRASLGPLADRAVVVDRTVG